MEKRGIPTVFFCTESFRGIVEVQVRLSGMPSYAPVTVPAPIVATPPQRVIAMVDQVADQIFLGLAKTANPPY